MKTVVLNRKFYVKQSDDGASVFLVLKNNGLEEPDSVAAGPFGSAAVAEKVADALEAKARAAEPDNPGMNDDADTEDAADALLAYLADNPELTKGLLAKAKDHARRKVERRERELRLKGLEVAVRKADEEINALKGRLLTLQKARKGWIADAAALRAGLAED